MNIYFEYLYRDAGNNKRYGEVIFSNRENADLEALEQAIRSALIDREFFVAEDAGIPELSFDRYDRELDHDWHQFDQLSVTDEAVTDTEKRDISELVSALENSLAAAAA